MFNYEKRLEYPIHIKETNPRLAKAIITQYGGPDGELGASMRYLSQRYTMPYKECMALLTDIGISVSKLRITHGLQIAHHTKRHTEYKPVNPFTAGARSAGIYRRKLASQYTNNVWKG